MFSSTFSLKTCAFLKKFSSALLVGLAIFCSTPASAQDGVSYAADESLFFGASVGRLLPFGVVGVRDNYPMWGLWFSHPSEVSQIEYGFLAANTKGVTWYNLSVGLRIDFDVVKAVQGYFTLGANAYYYKRKRTQLRTFDFVPSGGVHLGFGMMQEISNGYFFRADCKFAFGPGKTLYVGLGLMAEFDGGGEEGATP